MNRAARHVYLVKYEKLRKKTERDFQRLLALEGVPRTASINALVKLLTKTSNQDMKSAMEIMLATKI